MAYGGQPGAGLTSHGTECTVLAMNDEAVKITRFSDVCARWPGGREALAKALRVRDQRVRKWHERDNIPAEFWADIVAAARVAGVAGIDTDTLATIASQRRNLSLR